MNSHSSQTLLSAEDPPPVRILNPQGTSPFLLIGDHAGNAVPSALGLLGLSEQEMTRHIAWDIGIAGLGERLSAALNAVYIRQAYSRLVIDCNRDSNHADAIPAASDGIDVPANHSLTASDRAARIGEIHAPYHAAIATELARRRAAGKEAILVSLHSFTSVLQGIMRPWHIGILYSGGDTSFARSILKSLTERRDLTVGENQPYEMDSTDYTVPWHAFAANLRYVEIEIRQDLLTTAEHQAGWSDRLADCLKLAETSTGGGSVLCETSR